MASGRVLLPYDLAYLFITLFRGSDESIEERNEELVYIIDSAPILLCENMRIRRNKRHTNIYLLSYRELLASFLDTK